MTVPKMEYPTLDCEPTTETFKNNLGMEFVVNDNYPFLEDPNHGKTAAWVDSQIELYDQWMRENRTGQGIEQSDMEDLKSALQSMWDYEKRGCPHRRGAWYYFWRNTGLLNQAVLMRSKGPFGESMEVFFDPNELSADGTTSVTMDSFSDEKEARFWAYGISVKGSDWKTIKVRDTLTGDDLVDELKWVKFSGITFTKDAKGFFYSRFTPPASLGGDVTGAGEEYDKAEFQKVYYHRIGDTQEKDVLVFENKKEPKHMFGVHVTECGGFCLLDVRRDCEPVNNVYLLDTPSAVTGVETSKWKTIHADWSCNYSYIKDIEGNLIFETNDRAPKGKTVKIPVSNLQTETFGSLMNDCSTLLPEKPDVLAGQAMYNKKFLIQHYLKDASSRLFIHVMQIQGGNLGIEKTCEISLPSIGTVATFSGSTHNSELYFKFCSFADPGCIYNIDMSQENFKPTEVFQFPFAAGSIDSKDYITEQVFFKSYDGTKVPMFITKHVNTKSNAPCYLYGYGGFNISLMPAFSLRNMCLMRNLGAVTAIVNLRGGGEYGDEWHKQGTKENKQNVLDDMHSAAEHLISTGVTERSKLVISGGSNGGLLVLACANQKPELYAGVISEVPVADMLRFQRFTIGHAWCSEYGNADEGDVETLLQYSPIHNVNKKMLPPMLVTTASHDDRVVSMHAYKYVANAQHVHQKSDIGKRPILMRVAKDAGHGAGKPVSKLLKEAAEVAAFFSRCTGAKFRLN